ncbi:OLC1v1009586C1 [Oldenlandia corymbosa var. corymbosa]|uniref:OLC1v1009586C1 n=1 Tax=Oldenlandia corymbosa var. corymbosa TaxID=529605 RepID=A0AAV1DQU0_OLDCO|nr:OLC1v1009586C1 [Oldenlandia corymbosa var. corymbosa]
MPSPLVSCWFIIESFIIPEGHLKKWFYLSFYIHPIFLCFCQIFLWIKVLWRCYFLLILFLSRLILWVSSSCAAIFRVLHKLAFFFAAHTQGAAGNNTQFLDEEGIVEILENDIPQVIPSQNQLAIHAYSLPSYNNGLKGEIHCKVDSVFEAKIVENDAVSIDKNPSLIQVDDFDDSCISSPSCAEVELDNLDTESDDEGSTIPADSFDISPALSSVNISNLPNLELEFHSDENHDVFVPSSPDESEFVDRISLKVEELDSFYVKYEERMKWFDLLSLERAYGIDAIQNMRFGRAGFLESMVPAGLLEQTKEKLMKSLSSDYELVYVAQSCLSWEALHHQYRKVEEAIANSNELRFFHKDSAERFREFHILLERFVEDEQISTGQRHSKYVQRRFSQKKLLQVPQLSSIENDSITEEVMNVKATQVLKIIENCIKVFWVFLKSNTKKSTWKLNNSTTHPPIEDPRDLELLYDLRKTVRKVNNKVSFI